MSFLMNYAKTHEENANKEREKLDRVATKQAVIDNRVKTLEYKVFKRNGAIQEDENGN